MSLYRADWDLQSAESMAFFDHSHFVQGLKDRKFHGLTFEAASSGCGRHPTSPTSRFIMRFGGGAPMELRVRQRYGEASLLFTDANCNPPDVDLKADFVTKYAVGINLDGTLVSKKKQGSPDSDLFWYDIK